MELNKKLEGSTLKNYYRYSWDEKKLCDRIELIKAVIKNGESLFNAKVPKENIVSEEVVKTVVFKKKYTKAEINNIDHVLLFPEIHSKRSVKESKTSKYMKMAHPIRPEIKEVIKGV